MSVVREYYTGRAGRKAGSGSALHAHSGWTRARLSHDGNWGQGTGLNVRSAIGTGGGDGSGLLGTTHWETWHGALTRQLEQRQGRAIGGARLRRLGGGGGGGVIMK